jgi:dihydroorotase
MTAEAAGAILERIPGEVIMMYDLLLKGGTVLDPSQGIHARMDVAITAGRVAKVAPSIPRDRASRVTDVRGKVVAPGLIDIHAHVYQPNHNPIHPDAAGVWGGVTTVADAGGPGPANFPEFREVVLPQAKTKVYSFLSVFHDRSNPMANNESEIDVQGVVRTARENPGLVKGVKVLVYPRTVQVMGLRHVEAARAAAREAGLRVMMHIGDIGPKSQTPTPPEITSQALSMLEAGDIVTHIFTPLTGAALDFEGRLLPGLADAQERGVTLDTSYGDFNFGWQRAQDVMSQGLHPDTIGTDIDIQPGFGMRKNLMRGLLEYSAYFLEMGFSLEDVVRMTTVNAARALGIEETAGSLAVGREADVAVLEVLEGAFRLTDATGESRTGSRALVPFLTIKGGAVVEGGEAPHAWGWGPPAAETAAVAGDGDSG